MYEHFPGCYSENLFIAVIIILMVSWNKKGRDCTGRASLAHVHLKALAEKQNTTFCFGVTEWLAWLAWFVKGSFYYLEGYNI